LAGSSYWAVLIRTSMGASRWSVKKRQILSQSLAVHPSILSAARARVGVIDRGVESPMAQLASVAPDASPPESENVPLMHSPLRHLHDQHPIERDSYKTNEFSAR
jgi:hypothetical protein